MVLETKPWDAVDYLGTPERQAAYLEAAFEDGDPALIAAAIGDIARARGMSDLARETGVTRNALYKAFREGGNPTLATLASVVNALGYKLTVSPR
ncbi:MAG: putative addiction module antidote protein [Methylocystis sp.]|jgi:probable addiction module antidote protein|nr:putative addiction module antidote protein [Methylocystis sp.]MCA3585289.1 putative addiction module antidote protein [Methylocystis sp.]MCA3586856.1 putative addiction module antidote protein [Methylocystis sp.]MCA3591612.1 putative addiction module antidote protein [Methylocystis sp.]